MTQNGDILLRPAMLFAFFKVFPLVLLALTCLLLAWYLSPYFIVFSLAVCGVAWYRLLFIRSFKYLVSAEYILITKGIFFKRIDQVEMFRVKDYIITKPLILQLCKLMNLALKSTDEENKTVVFEGIPESDILDIIRERVLAARKNNNIYELT